MTQKRTCLWLIALTLLSALFLYLITINQSAWYPLMRSFTAGLDFTPTLGKMFTSGEALASLLANLFFYFGPAVSIMMALPICVVCWRAMSWGRPAVRFLCYLVWSAGMVVFCVYLLSSFFITGGLLIQLSIPPILMVWLAGGMFWLALEYLRQGGRPHRLLIAFTLIAVAFLGFAALTEAHWPSFLRVVLVDPDPEIGALFIFLHSNPFGLCLMLISPCAVCWRAMSWGRPGVRFLCYLLWSAAMAVFCFRLGIPALSTPKLLLLSCQPVFTAWLAGGLLWLMSGRVRPAAAGLGQPAL